MPDFIVNNCSVDNLPDDGSLFLEIKLQAGTVLELIPIAPANLTNFTISVPAATADLWPDIITAALMARVPSGFEYRQSIADSDGGVLLSRKVIELTAQFEVIFD